MTDRNDGSIIICDLDGTLFDDRHRIDLISPQAEEKNYDEYHKLHTFDIPSMTILTSPNTCLLYTSPSPRDRQKSRMPSSA